MSPDSCEERWLSAWAEVAATPAPELLEELIRRHEEPARAYHGWTHIDSCLELLNEVRETARRPAEVEIAIFFHDAIYDSRRNDNEESSARWAAECLRRGGARESVVTRIETLILATRHQVIPDDDDARLLVDIDLAILGAPPERFDAYEEQVREEYRWVPEPMFRAGRAELLRGFLGRPRIYATEGFRERLEIQARENLARSVARLEKSL